MIRVDFNARTQDGCVRLTTKGAKATLPKNVGVGDDVVLTDGEVEVQAVVEEQDGALVARCRWGTLLKKE
jgi:hypothetical protein